MENTQDYIRNLQEYDKHHFVTFLHDEKSGMEAFVAVHRKNKDAPSFGATRLWRYDSDTDALRDALRLSRIMSYKAALAGLPCGGAKGVIFDNLPKGSDHSEILNAYAEDIAVLKDSFITGTDVGIKQEDLALMKESAPNIIGFNDNSTEFTALGVYHGLCCALRTVFGSDSIKGRTFAIQGIGKIGSALLEYVAKDAEKVYVTDVNEELLANARNKYPNVKIVSPDAIHGVDVDVFCPCALSGAINSNNVAELSCSIVVGGANNQLESDQIGDVLHKMKILYAPDYVVNAGGLIAVYDEYEYPKYDHKRVKNKVMKIESRLQGIFDESRKQDRSTNRIANEMAEKTFNGYEQ